METSVGSPVFEVPYQDSPNGANLTVYSAVVFPETSNFLLSLSNGTFSLSVCFICCMCSLQTRKSSSCSHDTDRLTCPGLRVPCKANPSITLEFVFSAVSRTQENAVSLGQSVTWVVSRTVLDGPVVPLTLTDWASPSAFVGILVCWTASQYLTQVRLHSPDFSRFVSSTFLSQTRLVTAAAPVLGTIFLLVTKYPTGSTFRREGCILTFSLRGFSLSWQDCEMSGHVLSTVRRRVNAGAPYV